MPLARESLYALLFERLKTIQGLQLVTRRLKDWRATDKLREMPSLMMTTGQMTPEYRDESTPPVWKLTAWVYLYAYADMRGPSPDEVILGLVEKVEAALEWQPGEPRAQDGDFASIYREAPASTTLGGKVLYARIADAVKTDEGNYAVDGVAVAILPIEVVAIS